MQKHGFKKASVLLKKNIQKVSESRGFAQSRVLTHWSEIVGEEIASISVPTKVSYKTDGLGAILTVLASGSKALILEMQKEFMRNKINAVYGYNAVHKIRITQSSPIAVIKKNKISEGISSKQQTSNTEISASVENALKEVGDKNLRQALEELAINVFTKLHGKVSGIVYGGNSRKIKKFLQIGNKIHLINTSKNPNKIGYVQRRAMNDC